MSGAKIVGKIKKNSMAGMRRWGNVHIAKFPSVRRVMRFTNALGIRNSHPKNSKKSLSQESITWLTRISDEHFLQVLDESGDL